MSSISVIALICFAVLKICTGQCNIQKPYIYALELDSRSDSFKKQIFSILYLCVILEYDISIRECMHRCNDDPLCMSFAKVCHDCGQCRNETGSADPRVAIDNMFIWRPRFEEISLADVSSCESRINPETLSCYWIMRGIGDITDNDPCVSGYGHLAYVKTQRTFDFLVESGLFVENQYYLIGLRKTASSVFIWNDNTAFSSDYLWYPNEPNRPDSEFCGGLVPDGLVDALCDSGTAICELDLLV